MRKYVIMNKKGFTILEMTAVIFIVAFALVGILSFVAQNIKAQYINKNELIASMLAQEGIELIRNIRDTNWINNQTWNQSFGVPGYYIVDYVHGITSEAGPPLSSSLYDLCLNANGFYIDNPSGGFCSTPTNFKRVITISNTTTASTSVSCDVRWTQGGNNFDYVVSTDLYDWK